MNRFAVATLSLAAAAGAQAHTQIITQTARVRFVEPQYETSSIPRQECSSQLVTEQSRAPAGSGGYGGAIIGGVAGGLLGNQVGRGHGREAATAAGAVVGALTGDRLANGGSAAPQTRELRTCQTVYDQVNRLTGYRVVYEYRGSEFTTVMRQQPGPTIQMHVAATPLESTAQRF